MLKELGARIVHFIKKIVKEFSNKETLILFAVVVVVMYSPVLVGYLLFFIFRWKWCFALASAYLAFWAGPFTPFFPVCIAITHFLKRIWDRRKKRNAAEERNSIQQKHNAAEERNAIQQKHNAAEERNAIQQKRNAAEERNAMRKKQMEDKETKNADEGH